MDIKTKASVGDTIYYIQNNKLHSADVIKIHINVEGPGAGTMDVHDHVSIGYQTCHNEFINETEVGLSKQELANIIIGESSN